MLNLAASFQDAVIDVLVSKTIRAAQEYQAKQVIIAGGVAANSGLRQKMKEEVAKLNKKFTVPSIKNCTDNAAMIAAQGYYEYIAGVRSGWDLNAVPNLKIGKRG